MIPTKTTTNYLMNWDDPKDRINYLRNLRTFLNELHEAIFFNANSEKVQELAQLAFDRWNVYFIDIDEIPHVNLDEPK